MMSYLSAIKKGKLCHCVCTTILCVHSIWHNFFLGRHWLLPFPRSTADSPHHHAPHLQFKECIFPSFFFLLVWESRFLVHYTKYPDWKTKDIQQVRLFTGSSQYLLVSVQHFLFGQNYYFIRESGDMYIDRVRSD